MSVNEKNNEQNNEENFDQPSFELKSQYLKDCSFENPNAPECFNMQQQPKIGIAINLNATHMAENHYEVTLHLEAHAELEEDKSLFLASTDYCGIFAVAADIEEEELQQLLLVDGPSLLFPYARHIISDMTREGGFPALNLANVDFVKLYAQKKAQGLVDVVGKRPQEKDVQNEEPTSKVVN